MGKSLPKASPGMRYLRVGEQLPTFEHVDWQMAPRPFKVYQGCAQIALAYESFPEAPSVRGTWEQTPGTLNFAQYGQMLSDIYGATRLHRTVAALSQEPPPPDRMTLLRPVPSGGALFPCELYLLVGLDQALAPGIYHYDALHHALDILRRGWYSPVLDNVLACPPDDTPQLALLASCVFWKSGYKYGEFSYRLHSLDLGVVIAQTLLVSGRYGLKGRTHYRFLDTVINQLCGLDGLYESVYAIIAFPMAPYTQRPQTLDSSLEGSQTQGTPLAEPMESIEYWPLLAELHRRSLISTTDALYAYHAQASPPSMAPATQSVVALPAVDAAPNLLTGLQRRHSPSGYFRLEQLTRWQLAVLLKEGTRSHLSDLVIAPPAAPHLQLYCAINAVREMAAGIYHYDRESHALGLVREADFRSELQRALVASHDIFHTSICLFLVADYSNGFAAYGDRWYRMLNMEAGISIQHLSLAAAALELGCQINLTYHVQQTNTLLALPPGSTCLAQVLITPEAEKGQYYEQSLSR